MVQEAEDPISTSWIPGRSLSKIHIIFYLISSGGENRNPSRDLSEGKYLLCCSAVVLSFTFTSLIPFQPEIFLPIFIGVFKYFMLLCYESEVASEVLLIFLFYSFIKVQYQK